MKWNSLEPELVFALIITQSKEVGKGVFFFFFRNRIELGTWQNKGLGKENSVYEVPPKSWAP